MDDAGQASISGQHHQRKKSGRWALEGDIVQFVVKVLFSALLLLAFHGAGVIEISGRLSVDLQCELTLSVPKPTLYIEGFGVPARPGRTAKTDKPP